LSSSLLGGATRDLGCEDDFFAAGPHDFSNALLAAAIAIGMGSVDVTNAKINCAIECFERFLFFSVHQEAAARTEAENWYGDAGSTQSSRGKFIRFCGGQSRCGD